MSWLAMALTAAHNLSVSSEVAVSPEVERGSAYIIMTQTSSDDDWPFSGYDAAEGAGRLSLVAKWLYYWPSPAVTGPPKTAFMKILQPRPLSKKRQIDSDGWR